MASNNPTGLLHSKQSPSGGHIPGDCAHISSHAVYTAVIVRTEAPVLLFNGQTTPNSAKPSPPLRSPLKLSPDKKFLWPNGVSRRTRLSHGVLPALRLRLRPQRQRQRPRPSQRAMAMALGASKIQLPRQLRVYRFQRKRCSCRLRPCSSGGVGAAVLSALRLSVCWCWSWRAARRRCSVPAADGTPALGLT